ASSSPSCSASSTTTTHPTPSPMRAAASEADAQGSASTPSSRRKPLARSLSDELGETKRAFNLASGVVRGGARCASEEAGHARHHAFELHQWLPDDDALGGHAQLANRI